LDSEYHNIEITSIAHGGNGVGRVEGQVCFVPYALPGDTVRVHIVRRTKKILWGEIDEVISPSEARTKAPCSVFGRCGGCTWLHFAYPAQGEWKKRIVEESLARIAGMGIELAWAENAKRRLGYRTRADFHGDGEKLGFFAGASHDIVESDKCPLCHDKLNEAMLTLREIGVKGSVNVTINPDGDDVLVWTKFTKRKLKQYFPLAQSPKDEKIRTMFKFEGVPIVNGAFSQSSLLLNRVLVKTVHDMIGKPVSVLDLYCGNGNLTLGLPDSVGVLGMDHNKVAVKAAWSMKRGNYVTGGESKMRKLIAKGEADTIVLDPPRAGAKTIMPAIAESHARSIVYVSCDPATLARDVKVLGEKGWKITKATAVDMFPNTAHVETVCRLER
jgi:23S rRNA (uracil1939-C5)-methyltransferase